MEFVVWVLEEVFGKDREGATRTITTLADYCD
jgi:ATP-dependent Clp protease adapter protein ClpS